MYDVMMENLTPRERHVLARILMPYIVASLNSGDFGMGNPTGNDPRMSYVRPHLGYSSDTLMVKYLAKLSPTRRQWIEENADCIIVAGTANLKPSEIPYYKDLAKSLRLKHKGELLQHGTNTKQQEIGRKEDHPTKQVDGKNPTPKPKK